MPEGWQHGAFMEIFVRAYQDSDGDGVGDLRGLISRLDYLRDLGVRGIWLMPVTRMADGDHGYATTDHREIEPAYGSLADFDELLRQAHRRGIGVIMDYVINHGAAAHPLFQRALQGPQAEYRDWFVWSDVAPSGWEIWGKNPWYAAPGGRSHYFATFGAHMPDFNMRNPAVREYHFSSLRFWLERGLDGFRLDAVPHLFETSAIDWNDQPESRAMTRELQREIKAYPRRTVVCEATASPREWGDPAVCGGAFAFGHVQHYVKAAMGEAASVPEVARYFTQNPATMATFLSSHDLFAGARLWNQVGGDVRRYKLAAAGYLLQPGTPFIYYGEEVGQAGLEGLPGDEPNRGPMSWQPDARTAGFSQGRPFRAVSPNVMTNNARSQRTDPESLLNFYRAMLSLRNTRPSLARGAQSQPYAQGLVAGWQRTQAAERTLVFINYDTRSQAARPEGLPPGAQLRPLLPRWAAPARANEAGLAELNLPAQSVRVYDIVVPAP